MIRKALLFFLTIFTNIAFASPWVEADDAYFRSNIQLLADAGVINAPVNTYPLPWSLIADEIKTTQPDKLADHLQTAYYNVRFILQRAEGNRFQSSFKAVGENSAAPASYGQTNHAQWGVSGSLEYVADHFALRANAAYAQAHGDGAKFIDDGSYFALNYKALSLNVGRLERWWGPSWQSSLAQGQNARPMPAIALNYSDVNLAYINNLLVESFVAIVDSNSAYDYKWASRISSRPIKWLELSANYTWHWHLRDSWQERINTQDKNRYQLGFDSRISLPTFLSFQPGIYGQWQNDSISSIKDSYIVGFDFSGDLFNQQVRFITEYKNSNAGNKSWITWLSSVDQPGNESMLFGNTISVGSYIQFTNDHAMNIFIHHEKMQSSAVRVNASYRLPLLKGMLTFAFNYTNASWEKEHYQGGASWEYRF